MILRRIQKKDLQTRVDWMNNVKVFSNMPFSVPVLMDNTLSWFEKNQNDDKRIDVVFEEGDRLVAMGGLTNINRDSDKAEFYIFVDPDSHKSGIGTMATKILCKYGFEELGLRKIYLLTNENNLAARRTYEKCGFLLEGVHRCELKMTDGTLMSRLYYGLLRGELIE